MGTLKPGATYVYEKIDGTTYAREFGADPSTRFAVGHDYNARICDSPIIDHLREDKMWGDIRRLARTNPTLQAELDRVIMLYHLIKQENDTVPHHRV
jgi:hypothetical protein